MIINIFFFLNLILYLPPFIILKKIEKNACKFINNIVFTESLDNKELERTVESAKSYYDLEEYKNTKDIIAFAKLRVIVEALNEGWNPTFSESEYRYYLWFRIYSKDEFDSISDYYKNSEYYDSSISIDKNTLKWSGKLLKSVFL